MNYADIVKPQEMRDAKEWVRKALADLAGTQPPQHEACVSFICDGQPSVRFLYGWRVDEEHLRASAGARVHRVARTDPRTGLQVSVEVKEYTEFPAVEWVARLKNTGAKDTPIIESVKPLDVALPWGRDVFLNHFTGDYCAADGYEPHRVKLEPGCEHVFAPEGGRPTNKAWPYYNVECAGEQRGAFVVIGWSGQWASQFKLMADGVLHITGGQELTHFKLLPGEEVRTPLSVLMFWRGDKNHAHNLWRRWMMACNMPRPGGKLPAPFMPAGTSLWFNEMTQATEENQKYFINRYLEEKIQLDYWWMDAGWYPCEGNWPKTGTWDVDTKRFPRGLRAVADHVHPKGIKVLVWFEPERVAPGTWLCEQRPQWLLTCKGSDNRLLDLGNPEARLWLTDHVDGVINEQGIDLYRQDFNFDPLAYWRANDAPDRQGITEIRHVEGYLEYWDELQRRHPDMLIDSCASGGRRNDLETMRRSVPLHKTDYNYSDLPVKQAFHHTLSLWLPYYGAPVLPVDQVDAYAFRSAHAPMTAVGYDLRRKDLDYDLLRKLTQEWRRIAPYYYGDFYPLTPFSRTDDTWMAWQFHMPDKNEGMVQAFRRAHSPYVSASFKLCGLDARARYRITDLDAPKKALQMTGKELLETGLPVTMQSAPQAIILVYSRKR